MYGLTANLTNEERVGELREINILPITRTTKQWKAMTKVKSMKGKKSFICLT